MAGDWIKMDCTTPDKPEVLALTVKMGWDDPDLTVGKLFRLWRWFDQHTTDGNAVGVTCALLDRQVGVTGFIDAVASVGWLEVTDNGIRLSKFEKHNGSSAKSRAQTAKRVASHKTNAKTNADTVTGALPREEKRREEDSVTDVTGGEPPSARDEVFANGVPLLMAAAVPEKNARSMLAMLCKKHGEESVAQAVAQTAKDHAGEPVSWIQILLNAGSGPPPKRANAQEALEASNRAVMERMLAKENDATQ